MLFMYWLVHSFPVLVNEDTGEEWCHPDWKAESLTYSRTYLDMKL